MRPAGNHDYIRRYPIQYLIHELVEVGVRDVNCVVALELRRILKLLAKTPVVFAVRDQTAALLDRVGPPSDPAAAALAIQTLANRNEQNAWCSAIPRAKPQELACKW